MTEHKEINLSKYLGLLWNGKWVILLSTLVALIGVIAFVELKPATPPTYDAIATVRIDPVQSPTTIGIAGTVDSSGQGLNTHKNIMSSQNVLERATEILHHDETGNLTDEWYAEVAELRGAITVRAIPDTNLLEARARAATPDRAKAMADAVVQAYIEHLTSERTRADQESLAFIKLQLEEFQQASGLSKKLKAVLPSMGSELSFITQSVDRNLQVLSSLHDPVSIDGNETPLDWEGPQVLELSTTLNAVSLDLMEIQDHMAGTQPGVISDSRDGPTSLEAARLDKVTNDLDVSSERLSKINSTLTSIDPFKNLEAAASSAAEAEITLKQVPYEMANIRIKDSTTSRQISDVIIYIYSVERESDDLASQLRTAGYQRTRLTKNAIIELRGLVSGHIIGLKKARSQVQDLSTQNNLVDLGRIGAVEGYISAAIGQYENIADELESFNNAATIQDDVTEVLEWTDENRRNLSTVTVNIRGINSSSGAQGTQPISIAASYELESISLSLEAAAARLQSLIPRASDPLLKAQLKSVATAMALAQNEVSEASARLGFAILGESVTLPEGLRLVQERIQEDSNALQNFELLIYPKNHVLSMVNSLDSMALVYKDSIGIDNSLDIAIRQLKSLARLNSNPLLEGELGVLIDQLINVRSGVKELSNRLSLVSVTGKSARTISISETRLKAVSDALKSGTEMAKQDLQGEDSARLQDIAARFTEQADISVSILGLVINDIVELQNIEPAPIRYGQLGVLAERMRDDQAQIKELSVQLHQTKQGKGEGYFGLRQLSAELEFSLLQPQETGLTIVDSAVILTRPRVNDSFFAKTQIPLSAIAGLLLGSVAVLLKAQVDPRVNSQVQLQERLNLENLGVLPKGKILRGSRLPMVSGNNPTAFFEALQLMTNIISRALASGTQSFLITSGTPKEGKTTLSINLAHVIARHGHRVILVDGNLRKPDVAKALKLPEDEGLSTALAQQQNPMDYIVTTDGFDVLPGGPTLANPAALLSSAAMTFFLRQIKSKYDVVIIDGPPVLGFAETNALAKGVSGAVLVVKSGVANIESLKQCKEDLELEVNSVGTVLNFASAHESRHLQHETYGSIPAARGGDWLTAFISVYRRLSNIVTNHSRLSS